MLNSNKRFSTLGEAEVAALKVANILECNVPIYADLAKYHLWNGNKFIKWIKPSLLEFNDY